MVYQTLRTMNRFPVMKYIVLKSTWSQYVQTMKFHKQCKQRAWLSGSPHKAVKSRTLRQFHILSSCSCIKGKNDRSKCSLLKRNGRLLMYYRYSTAAIDNDLLLKYLESLEQEYKDIFESSNKGVKSSDINARKVFLAPLVELYHQLNERSRDLNELKQLASGNLSFYLFFLNS